MSADVVGGRRRRHGRGRVVAFGLAVLVLLGAGAYLAFGSRLGRAGTTTVSATAGPVATATVTRQTLVDRVAKSGTLGYGRVYSLSPRLTGTLTWLPDVGTKLTRGKALYKVDNTPVVLLYGTLPAYRVLAEGVEGDDVRQFEQNLAALGYKGFTVDKEYTSSTVEAVKEWQEDLGLPETGRIEPGRVAYLPGEMRVNATPATAGDQAGPGPRAVDLTALARVVTVELDTRDQRLARTGATVPVELPDGTSTNGKVTRVATIVKTGQEGASTKIEVTVTLADQKAGQGYDEAAVTVSLTADERKNVLTVPVAALVALAEGGYGVQVVDGATTRYVAVETGLFAAGRVEVSGTGIAEGTSVGVPS